MSTFFVAQRELMLNLFFSKHSYIKCTMDFEKHCIISFLDRSIFRNNNKFKISIFWKSTFSGLVTSIFKVFVCSVHGIHGIKTLISRAYSLYDIFFHALGGRNFKTFY